ncbi:hypothetical protein MferCBS31731_004720 [Microsporum ferrugineum]
MKLYLLLTAVLSLLCAVNARFAFYYANITVAHCPAPDGDFCYEGLRGPMVIRCSKGSVINTINCKKYETDRTAMCFESSETSGDATCLHRNMITLTPAVEKDSSTPIPYVNFPRSVVGTEPMASTLFISEGPARTPSTLQTETVVSTMAPTPGFIRSPGLDLGPGGKVPQSSAHLRTEPIASTFIPAPQFGKSSEDAVISTGLSAESTTTLSTTTTTTDAVLTSLWTSAHTREVQSSMTTPEQLTSYPTTEVTSDASTSMTKHEENMVPSTHYTTTLVQPTSELSTSSATPSSVSTTSIPLSTDMSTVEPTISSSTTVSSTSTTTTSMFITFTPTSTTQAETTVLTETFITEQPQKSPTTESKEATESSVTLSPSTLLPTSVANYTSYGPSSLSMLPTQTTLSTYSARVTVSTSFTSTIATVHTNHTSVHTTPTYSIATSTLVNAAEENTTDAKLAYLFGLIVAFLVLV